jgi:hypothetical protein
MITRPSWEWRDHPHPCKHRVVNSQSGRRVMRAADVVVRRLPVSRVSRGVGLAAAAVLLAACGGGGGDGSGTPPNLPSRTGTVEPSVTASVPSPTRTLPTRSTAPTQTTTETATVTETPTQTPTEQPTPSAAPTSSPPGEASSDTTGTPSWVWWLLGAMVIVAGVAIPLLVRASRRRAWRTDLAAAEQEVGWFVRVLLPELQRARSAAEVRGGWGVGEARVVAVEARLTALAASARDDAGRARAVVLRDAVRLSRERIGAIAGSEAADVSRDLAAVSADLAATLGQPASPSL